jgi:LmbE family N-acetylglucosaminyl deacetylase
MTIEQAERRNTERITGVPNVTFDLTAVLHNKLEAIAAYEVYKQDAREVGHRQAEAFFDQCQQFDRTAVQQLRELLAQDLSIGPPWATPTAGDVVVE